MIGANRAARQSVVQTGSTIPDSATLRYPVPDTTTPLQDSIGSNNGTLSGTTSFVSDSKYQDGNAADIETSSSYVEPQNSVSEIDGGNDWSVGITVESDNGFGDAEVIWNCTDSNGDVWHIVHDGGEFVAARWDTSAGSYDFQYGISSPSAPYIVRLYVTYDSSADDLIFYLNNSNTYDSTGNGYSTGIIFESGSSGQLYIGVTDDGSSYGSDPIVDDFIVQDAVGDSQLDYDRQPWS